MRVPPLLAIVWNRWLLILLLVAAFAIRLTYVDDSRRHRRWVRCTPMALPWHAWTRDSCCRRFRAPRNRPSARLQAIRAGAPRAVRARRERVARGRGGFVEGVDDDEMPLTAAGDRRVQGCGEEVIEQLGCVLSIEIRNPLGGSTGVSGSRRAAWRAGTPGCGRRVSHRRPCPTRRSAPQSRCRRPYGSGRDGALADTWRPHDPEEPRGTAGGCSPGLDASSSHRRPWKAPAEQRADARGASL
jgi:hypothetical protein